MRDALDDSELYLNDDEDGVCFKRRNLEPAPKVLYYINFLFIKSVLIIIFLQILDPKWEKYACGQTKDQIYLTHLARQTLKKTTLQPRSLNFFSNN